MANSCPDQDLLRDARRGDERAFLRLYEQHRDAVFRFIRRLCGSPELAEDVTHDCFLSLIRAPAPFDPRRASLRTYFCAIARNLAFSRLRREGREVALEDGPDEVATDTEAPLDGLVTRERSEAVAEAVARLPPLQREAIILFEYEELSLMEIAEVAMTDVGTIKSRLHRARESLRRALWRDHAAGIARPSAGRMK